MKNVLITGGSGYIGSHTVLELIEQGFQVIVIDNLCNSSSESLRRIEKLTGKSIVFIQGDVRDEVLLNKVFAQNQIDAVFHFAGLKAVEESVSNPLLYYENNVIGSLVLLRAMQKAKVFTLLFSSSATVYGQAQPMPLTEDLPLGMSSSPYGVSKQMIEKILQDTAQADRRWRFASLRYFNPMGADKSGEIGESPRNMPNNLLPCICQVAVGELEKLLIFGDDYRTKDGTCIRDYIHVSDVAKGHVAALDYLSRHDGFHVWNLGTGKGYSVWDVIATFEKVSGKTIPYEIVPRRLGDVDSVWASAEKSNQELDWQAEFDLSQMLRDSWHWQKKNPNGYLL